MSKAPTTPHACNVLSVDGDTRRLHHFSVGKSGVTPAGGFEAGTGKPLPANLVARDWRLLVRSRLDVAWMPPEAVFLRAVPLPACAPEELAGMIEFQLEKLSPMPPAQVVWTVESVPHPGPSSANPSSQHTAVVTIVARSVVEAFVDSLEQGGYQADRIELPGLRRLLVRPVSGDSLRVVLEGPADGRVALIGWWVSGVLREVSRIRLPAEGAADHLTAHLHGTAWAAEMDGWLSGIPAVTLVVEGAASGAASGPAVRPAASPVLDARTVALREALRDWSNRTVEVETSAPEPELARLTAEHALRPVTASLIPDEVRQRQRRLYVDSLWVKGLTALAMTYLAGVFVYLAVLTFRRSSVDTLRDETRAMALQYTNTLQIKARVRVLQEQFALRFAALDCWNAVVEKLPEALTLVQFDFKNGRTLVINGNASEADRGEVTRFNDLLRAATLEGKPLFSEVKPATMSPRGTLLSWTFEAELRREEGAVP